MCLLREEIEGGAISFKRTTHYCFDFREQQRQEEIGVDMNSLKLKSLVFVLCLFFGFQMNFVLGENSIQIGEPLHHTLPGEDSESIDSAFKGRLLVVTMPELVPNVDPEDETEVYNSRLAYLLNVPFLPISVSVLFTVDLGPGEVTDVALHPLGLFTVANIREDDVNELNQLVIVKGNVVTQRLDLPGRADGINLSPSGDLLVVAIEKDDKIAVYDTSNAAENLRLVAVVDREAFEAAFVGEEARYQDEDFEPESVKFNHRGSMALISLQEQSSIAVLDMRLIRIQDRKGRLTPEEIGARALNVVHLPFGVQNSEGKTVGVEPDGLSVSPNDDFALIANEADSDSRHLMGVSVLDLRRGPRNVRLVSTFCIFDLDPTLLDGTGLSSCPLPGPNGEYPVEADELPRLDPNNTKIVRIGRRSIAAVNIERGTKVQDRGSILFLDMSRALQGIAPTKIDRKVVGLTPGVRPEGLLSTHNGRFIWAALQADLDEEGHSGSVVRIKIEP